METTTTTDASTTDPALAAAHAVIMAERVRNLLTEEPQFLPHFISLMGYCNRQLAKIERAKVCDCDERYATQLSRTLALVAGDQLCLTSNAMFPETTGQN